MTDQEIEKSVIPALIQRHFPTDWILEQLQGLFKENMSYEKATSKLHIDGFSNDEQGQAAHERFMMFLDDLHKRGKVQRIKHGEDRGLDMVIRWNKFVDEGVSVNNNRCDWAFYKSPLLSCLRMAPWTGVYDAVKVLEKAKQPITYDQLPAMAENVQATLIKEIFSVGRYSSTDAVDCPQTGEHLTWMRGEDALLAPVLGQYKTVNGKYEFFPIEAYTPPQPTRMISLPLPSGVLMAADWFRIPGFTEGVEDQGFGISSAKGVDERTKDHYERLGLLRIHTTNCAPYFIQLGEKIFVGYVDEDAFYEEDQEWGGLLKSKNKTLEASSTQMTEVGYVCCDLWDVTMADREVLADILMKGAEILKGKSLGENCPQTRDEALAMLDEYAEKDTVTVLRTTPGTVLNIHMATGHGSTEFENFITAYAPNKMREILFTISTAEIDFDPSQLEPHNWSYPAAYRLPHNPQQERLNPKYKQAP